MNPEQQRIALAEACGWGGDEKCIRDVIKRHDEQTQRAYYQDRPLPKGGVPDYPNDLNAMHEAWKTLTPSQKTRFESEIYSVVIGDNDYNRNDDAPYITNATAAQRAEAFLRTIKKWTETNSMKEPAYL